METHASMYFVHGDCTVGHVMHTILETMQKKYCPTERNVALFYIYLRLTFGIRDLQILS